MELMVCIDGAEHATVPLKDGDDGFNREAERGALDRAYEAKESNPDSVVTVVVVGDEPAEVMISMKNTEWLEIRDALRLLADLDEGENVDVQQLRELSWLIDSALVTHDFFFIIYGAGRQGSSPAVKPSFWDHDMPMCPVCERYEHMSMWAEDGESSLADFWDCKGCGAEGAVVAPRDTTVTQNGLALAEAAV